MTTEPHDHFEVGDLCKVVREPPQYFLVLSWHPNEDSFVRESYWKILWLSDDRPSWTARNKLYYGSFVASNSVAVSRL